MMRMQSTEAASAATPFVALRMPADHCYGFLGDLRGWDTDCSPRDCIDFDLGGETGETEFGLLLLFAKSASNFAAEAPIFFAHFYEDPTGPIIVLLEEGTDMVHVLVPRASEALCRIAQWMANEIFAESNGKAA